MDIKYKLEAFEGPLDLLLHLITKNKVSIYDIPIVEITNQYLDAICFIDDEKLENSSEFIIMAVQLLYIKSKMLLPKNEENDENEEDPREELAKRLEEYSYLKRAVLNLRRREFYDSDVEYREEEIINFPVPVYDKKHELSELLMAINDIIERKRRKTEPQKESFLGIVGREKVPIADMEQKVRVLLKKRRKLSFSSVFLKQQSKPEKIATFLALLEMIKENKISAEYSHEEREYVITNMEGEPNAEYQVCD